MTAPPGLHLALKGKMRMVGSHFLHRRKYSVMINVLEDKHLFIYFQQQKNTRKQITGLNIYRRLCSANVSPQFAKIKPIISIRE